MVATAAGRTRAGARGRSTTRTRRQGGSRVEERAVEGVEERAERLGAARRGRGAAHRDVDEQGELIRGAGADRARDGELARREPEVAPGEAIAGRTIARIVTGVTAHATVVLDAHGSHDCSYAHTPG